MAKLTRHNAVRLAAFGAAYNEGLRFGNSMLGKRKRSSSSTSHVSRTSSARPVSSKGSRRGSVRQRRKTVRKGKPAGRSRDNQIASGKDVSGFTYNLRGFVSKGKLQYVSAKNVYRVAYGQRLTTTGGVQNMDLLGYDGSGVAGIGSAGIFNVYDIEKIRTNIGTIQTTTTVGVNNANQWAIPSAVIEYQLSNSTNANIIVWLYDIVPRRTMYSSDTNIVIPMAAWTQGMQVTTGTGGGSTIAFNIGSRPFESKLFCESYKVKKVTKLVLSPGVLHRHIVRSSQRRWWSDAQYFNTFTVGVPATTASWIGKRTVLTMAVIQGSPGHSQGFPDSARVSTAPAAIDVITRKSYTWMYSASAAKKIIWIDTVPAANNDLETIPEAGDHFVPIVTN
jgi:hypothetical protein